MGAGVRRALSRAEPAVQPFLRLGARIGRPLASALNSRAKNLRWAGAELGLLAFLANSVMVGPMHLPADTLVTMHGAALCTILSTFSV